MTMITDPNFLPYIRETVTIVRPMPSVVSRGRASSKEQQPTRSLRMPPEVLEAIDEAAALVGMSRSAFMSWCSNQVALDLIRQYSEYKNTRK